MFENDHTINGRHATYLKYLVSDAKIFGRYIDVYMNAVVWGLLYGRRGSRDASSADRARIYADAFANERDNCTFLYRLAMLVCDDPSVSSDERVDRAFRHNAQDHREQMVENMQVFNEYVLGGIEVLYEKYTERCTTKEDYLRRIFELMKTFKNEIDGVPYDEQLAKLIG